jgi:hypothetical protein
MSPDQRYCVYNSDIDSLERAIKERVFYVKSGNGFAPPPRPAPKIFEERLREFSRLFDRSMTSTTPITRQDFVEMYQGRKRVIYQKASDSLVVSPVTRRDSFLKAFVKAEKGKPGSAPRVIQPRDPRYNVEVGRYLKPIEGRVYRGIAKVWGERVVMKGMNAGQVGNAIAHKWKSFYKPVAVGIDASRFDQHISADALEWEHKRYIRCFTLDRDRRELSRLLGWQIYNTGRGYCHNGRLKYKIKGCRCSGDMNTATGNCLIMCALVWAYVEEKRIRCSFVNNGDDCVVIMESIHLGRFMDGFMDWFLLMGFTMTVEKPVYELEQIQFCQAQPIFDGNSYTMIRIPAAFHKDSISLVNLTSERVLKAWLGAVGDGGMSLTGGIPIWQEFYEVFQRSAGALSSKRKRRGATRVLDQSAMETGMMMAARGMTRAYGDVSPESRFSFWLAFGITPDYQRAVESLYRSVPLVDFTFIQGLTHLPLGAFVL